MYPTFPFNNGLPSIVCEFLLPSSTSSYEEQRNSGQEMIYKLQSILESERKNCGSVSEERLKLQQENEQFQKEMEELRKLAVEAQQAAKLKVFAFIWYFIFDVTSSKIQ